MVAVVDSASICQWVAERNRAGLGEKIKRDFRKELRGSCPHQEAGSPGSWSCGRRKDPCKCVEGRQRTIWRDRDERAMGTLSLNQKLESPEDRDEVEEGIECRPYWLMARTERS